MLKHKRDNMLRNCLICWRCGAWCGPAHYVLKDMGAFCSVCNSKNPLLNMKKMTMQDLTEPRLVWIPWTRSGTSAHGLAPDGRTVLGPWITFVSAETFERALRHIGMTDEQLEKHRRGMQQAGNGCAMVSTVPGNRKNLFRIDWTKLG
jgi:hypothetical protein